MTEAKIPDDKRNWNALDIYVFCNGQQYTPPRKFHLQSDKLKFWESTLKFLARSQYGSAYSTVNLYSIEGKKVQGPLELTNDAAYVAVAPHDCFRQSGYDKYLLKASRSREKRQEKRFNNNNASQDDQAFGILTIKMNNVPKVNTTLMNDIDKNKGKPNVSNRQVPARSTSIKSPLNKSPIEKRKMNSRNTILRKINNSGKVVNPSHSLKGKGVTAKNLPDVKESLNFMCKKSTPLTSEIIENVSSHIQNTEKYEGLPANAQEPEKIITVLKESSKSNTTLDVIVEKDDGDNITQKTVFQNLESDDVSYFVDADPLSRKANNLQRTSLISTFNCSELVNDNQNLVSVPTQSTKREVDNKTKNDRNSEDITQKCSITTTDEQPNTENKECIINLHLNIELKNCNAHSIQTGSIFSKSFSLNPEKQSQTNLQIDDYLNRLNTMKSILENDGLDCEHKVIIIRCSCGGENNECSFKNVENPPHYIFLPPQNIPISDGHQSEDLRSEKGDTGRVITKADGVKEHKVSISTCSPTICESTPSTMDSVTISNSSTSTQTDWCNTLVEARCNNDGSYSFHLPSLEKLKELKL